MSDNTIPTSVISSKIQTIHNFIVRELHLDNNNEQCYLVCLLLLAFK